MTSTVSHVERRVAPDARNAYAPVPSRRSSGAGSIGHRFAEVASLIPADAPARFGRFDAWVGFYRGVLADLFERAHGARPIDDRSSPAAASVPEIDEVADNGAEVQVLHRFSEREMVPVDAFLEAVPVQMRRHPDFQLFEGEEIVASWVSRDAVALPTGLPSIGTRAQGGYLMHMAGDARQRAHVHGIPGENGSWHRGTGGRFLVGLFGARRSTIRTAHGVHRIPRGALATIHFPQTELGPTAHQFWNEDESGGVGNVLFSFHCRDFLGEGESAGSSNMMGRRTFHLSADALRGAPGHGFVASPHANEESL